MAAPKYLLPEAARTVDGGRGAVVVLAQSEFKAEIVASNAMLLGVALTGGAGALVGGMVDAKINADRTARADQTIAAIRNGMSGFDVNALAFDTTKAVLAANPWLATGEPAICRESTWEAYSAVLDASPARQQVFFDYSYALSADFSSIKVVVTVEFANKDLAPGKKPTSRLHLGKLPYYQTLTSIVTLPNPSRDPLENAARWGADNAALAKKGLTLAFQGATGLATTALNLTSKDEKVMMRRDKPQITVAGITGWNQGKGPDGQFIYTYQHGLALTRVLD
jgi:hypothetical protein